MLRRTSLFFLWLLLIGPSAAWAQDTYRHPESRLEFPARMGSFERGPVHRFDDPKLGVQINYVAPALGKIDVYVFDAGMGPVPDGTVSDLVRGAYVGADRDVRTLVERGLYSNFEAVVPLGAALKLPGGTQEWWVSTYRFRGKTFGDDLMHSWLLVTGDRGHFVKIRYTHPDSRLREARAELEQFLDSFATANKPPNKE